MTARKFFFVMLALIILSVAGSGAGYYWIEGQLKTRADKVSDLLAERDAQAGKIRKLELSKKSLDNAKDLKQLIDELLPKQKNQENLIGGIVYTATQEAKIPAKQLKSLSFSGSGQPDTLSGTNLLKEFQGVYVYPFSIVVDNISYDTMINLFAQFEKNARIIQADQVSITPDQEHPGMISGLSLSLKTFVHP